MNRVFNFIRPLQDRQFNNLAIGLLIVGMLAMIIFVIQARIFQRQDALQRQPVSDAATATAADSRDGMADLPLFTDEVRRRLEASTGFQYLVSYTDRGFEPANLHIHAGETIRFTNNSVRPLQLVAEAENTWPTDASCGEASSDACRHFDAGEFRELTFATAGEFRYRDAEHTLLTGLIVVE